MKRIETARTLLVLIWKKKSKITITSRVGDDEMLDSTRTNFVEAARDFDGGSGNDLR